MLLGAFGGAEDMLEVGPVSLCRCFRKFAKFTSSMLEVRSSEARVMTVFDIELA